MTNGHDDNYIDLEKDIHDSWIKLLNHISNNFPEDLPMMQELNEKYGNTPKNIFEQGYRTGFRKAVALMNVYVVAND
jgi:hypothetical protein